VEVVFPSAPLAHAGKTAVTPPRVNREAPPASSQPTERVDSSKGCRALGMLLISRAAVIGLN
jgi:hypothetical protein